MLDINAQFVEQVCNNWVEKQNSISSCSSILISPWTQWQMSCLPNSLKLAHWGHDLSLKNSKNGQLNKSEKQHYKYFH